MNTSADWFPDPQGRHEHRWFDGVEWTDEVSSHGLRSTDPLGVDAKRVTGTTQPSEIEAQVRAHDAQSPPRDLPAPQDDTGLLDQSTLVMNQKTKLIEVNTEFAIYNASGVQVGAIRQVGQSRFKKTFRFLGTADQLFTHILQIVDHEGVPVLVLTRPRKFMKSRIVVADGAGNQIGQIVQRNVFGKIRFGLEANGNEVGELRAENWRAWNFGIVDTTGREVARITKTFEGVMKTMFTSADNYVLRVHAPLSDPLRALTLATAASVDLALKQDGRGLGAFDIFDLFWDF